MPNYVNILDVLNVTALNGGSQYLTDEDVWYWDNHLSKQHVDGTISYVPRYCIRQINGVQEALNIANDVNENFMLTNNTYYATPDYLKGVFLYSKSSKELYYIDIPSGNLNKLARTGTPPSLVEGAVIKGKLLEYRPISNWLFYANLTEARLYKYDVSNSIWSIVKDFPTAGINPQGQTSGPWDTNSEPDKEVTLLVDQVTNKLYMMTRNMHVVSPTQKTILYTYRLFEYDLSNQVWIEMLRESTIDLYQYGTNQEAPHTTGKCVIHNGKLYVFNFFTEIFPSGTTGRVTYLSYVVINISNGAIEKNDWLPFYNQTVSCTSPIQITRYGTNIVLITPECPNVSCVIDPVTHAISYLRVMAGSAQATQTIRISSPYAFASIPASNVLYDPRERKSYAIGVPQAELVADYTFSDQIYTSTIQMDLESDSNGLVIYIDNGSGAFTSATGSYNASSKAYIATINGYLKRFRVVYTMNSYNNLYKLYKIRAFGDPSRVWFLDSAGTSHIDSYQFNNILIGTPTASQLFKVQNNTGFITTGVRVYIEPDGDTGSYFTEISTTSDTGFIRHCTANTGTNCSKGFNFATRACASGRCGGYERATLLPTPQAVKVTESIVFYVRVNVPAGQSRVNRQARVVAQLEY